MKELDVLLERFLDDALAGLDAAAVESLAALLEHPDQDILAWLVGSAAPPDPALDAIVARVRVSVVARRV